jgi:Ras-related protein Rab-1A
MVYDVTHRESFDHVREWLKEVEKYAAPETAKLLIGNKSDRSDRAVSEGEGAALAKELGGMPFLETSARTSDNVEAAFIKMAENLIAMRQQVEAEPREKVSLDAAPAKKAGGGCC